MRYSGFVDYFEFFRGILPFVYELYRIFFDIKE